MDPARPHLPSPEVRTSVTVRPLEEGDLDAAFELRLRGLREEETSFGRSADEEQQQSREAIRARFLGGPAGSFSLGAFDGGTLVGIVGLSRFAHRKRAHRATLWGMYVAREAQGRGVGRLLLDALIAKAKTVPGLEQIVLTVIADNASAVSLYESSGFVTYGREPDAMRTPERTHDELSMVLRLGARAPVAGSAAP